MKHADQHVLTACLGVQFGGLVAGRGVGVGLAQPAGSGQNQARGLTLRSIRHGELKFADAPCECAA